VINLYPVAGNYAKIIVGTEVDVPLHEAQLTKGVAFFSLLQFPVQKIFIHIFTG
jgi:hypothetical protein